MSNKKNKTMAEVTKGYEKFAKGKKVDENKEKEFDKVLKSSVSNKKKK